MKSTSGQAGFLSKGNVSLKILQITFTVWEYWQILGVFMVITRVVFLRSIYGHLVESELWTNSGLAECYTAGMFLEFCTVWSMHMPACFTPRMEAVFSPQQAPSSCQGCELSVLTIYNQKQQKPTSIFVNYAVSCGGKWSQTVCIFLMI